MGEKKETIELKDEELEKVTGGGSGTVPQGGITFETYGTLTIGRYYTSSQDFQEVVYVCTVYDKLCYSRELFKIDASTNSWRSINKHSSGEKYPLENIPGFMSHYPYMLNVYPN